jgi:hypothetical protein
MGKLFKIASRFPFSAPLLTILVPVSYKKCLIYIFFLVYQLYALPMRTRILFPCSCFCWLVRIRIFGIRLQDNSGNCTLANFPTGKVPVILVYRYTLYSTSFTHTGNLHTITEDENKCCKGKIDFLRFVN